jgi:hypothetical protein
MRTSVNGTTLPTHQTGFGVYPYTYIPDSSVYFCPNYLYSFTCCNPYKATLDLPIGSFPAGPPEFIGENMTMNWGPYSKGHQCSVSHSRYFRGCQLVDTRRRVDWLGNAVVPRFRRTEAMRWEGVRLQRDRVQSSRRHGALTAMMP